MLEIKKGENIDLLKVAPELKDVIVAIKWSNKPNDITEFEIDSSAFLLTEKNKVRRDEDFVFYNQPQTPDNSVVFKNQMFKVVLSHLPPEIKKISFVLTLHNAQQKKQNLGLLDSISIELFDLATKQKIATSILKGMGAETALILGQLYRYHIGWKFKIVGQGYAEGLEVLARNYGVEISSENASETEEKNAISVKSKPAPPTKAINLHNTDIMTKQSHYKPIVQWLKMRNFEADVNEHAMDTSGFFDEVAIELGNHYSVLKIVSNTIKRRQQSGHDRAYINIANCLDSEITLIRNFCKNLYDYSFVAKYFYNTSEKKITLHLQSATKIVNFFNGEWFEWFAFMKIADFCQENNLKFSCTRNMVIKFLQEKYEIDVFFLINDKPLFIECKSGEYRSFIDKYTKLRRKMLMQKPNFLFLLLGVDDEHLKGLTAMFDMTFVNEKNLIAHIHDTFLNNVSS